MKKFVVLMSVALVIGAVCCPNCLLADTPKKIIVGGKTFTEQFLLARILTLMLQAEGYDVEEKVNMSTNLIRRALLEKEIDLYWEYTGTAYGALFQQTDPAISSDPETLYTTVKELDQKNGVVWLAKASLNNTWALVIKKDLAQKYQISTISDLAQQLKQKNKIRLSILDSFNKRPDGFKKLIQHYEMTVPDSFLFIITTGDRYSMIKRGQSDVTVAYATDAFLAEYDLVVLEDDRRFFPVYNPAPTILAETLQQDPRLGEIANKLGPLLDTPTMTHLNYLVEVKEQPVEDVARNWLRDVGLLP